ncbi:MAG: MFS transporter [Candidatus Bathyarchaeota archaeon]
MVGLSARLRDEFGFLRGNLLVLITSYVIFGFTTGLFNPFRSLYIRELGASPLVLGLMSSLGSVILAIIRVPGAYIADRYGRRNIIVLFTFGAALSYGFYVIAPDWRLILVAVVVSNLSHIYQPALEAIEADSMPPEKRGLGYMLVWWLPGAPGLFAPAISGYMVERYGLVPGMRMVYVVVFVSALTIALIRWRYLKETMAESAALGLRELSSAFREAAGSIREAWLEMGREIWFLAAVLLLVSFENPLYNLYYALYAVDVVGVSAMEWGMVSIIGTAAMSLVGIPAGKLIDRIGRRKSMLLAYAFSLPALIAFTVIRGFTQMVVVNISFLICNSLLFPSIMALQADLVPQERRGRIMGLMGTLRSLAMVPAGIIFGLLYEVNRAYPYYVGVLVEVAIILVILFFIKEPEMRER